MHRLLITGGSGFVGQNLARYFQSRWQTAITYLSQRPTSAAESFQLDVRESNAVFALFEQVKPTLVIHAAGNKDIRFCESEPAEATRVNAEGTRNVARACRKVEARMIYVSTDLVFSCEEGNYKEDDLPEPQLSYGKSKLLGEKFASEELANVAICRSGGIFGSGSPLLKWFSAEIEARRNVECFVDVFNTPTYVDNLAEMIEAIVANDLAGIFHTVGRERVSRLQFFQEYANTFDLDASLLTPVSISSVKEKMFLQPDSSLSSEKTAASLGVTFNSPAEGFTRLRARRDM